MNIGNSDTDELQGILNQAAVAVGTVGAQVSLIVDGQRADLLVHFPGFANAVAIFFFGRDAQERATHINCGLRTARRVAGSKGQ